jgi:site-specific DNA-methyltransferase (adenine-specific)
MIELLHEDNMKLMARYPDKYFDLAIVDPPYGIDADKKNSGKKLQCRKSSALSKDYGNQEWDSDIPDDKYFEELKRVSKRQIVWGANFFGLTGGYLYWHKNVTMPTYSTGELAWLSWLNKLDYVEITWHGMIQHDMQNKEIRVHPTQKPVQLYRWLLDRYAKQGDKILDTHLGSGSIAIACHDMGFDLVACEIDEDYYNAAVKRLNEQTKQLKLIA